MKFLKLNNSNKSSQTNISRLQLATVVLNLLIAVFTLVKIILT